MMFVINRRALTQHWTGYAQIRAEWAEVEALTKEIYA